MNILGIQFIETCFACPEQYDAFLEGKSIGYLRLRHGFFYAKYLHCSGYIVFEGHPRGDDRFADEADREHFMTLAAKALLNSHLEHNPDMFCKLVEAAVRVIDEYEGQMEGPVVYSIEYLREALKKC